jgi:hypothetical protein
VGIEANGTHSCSEIPADHHLFFDVWELKRKGGLRTRKKRKRTREKIAQQRGARIWTKEPLV